MSSTMFFDLIGFVCLCSVGAYVLTQSMCSLSLKFDLVDRPDGNRKTHGRAVPLMGGVAVFVTVLAAAGVAWLLQLPWLQHDSSWKRIFPTLFFSAGIMCVVGLWDDKRALKPRTKLLWQVVAAFPWALAGRVLDPIQLFGTTIDLGVLGFVFVMVWLVACSNLINLIDGMDGLAGTICLIISATVTVLALSNGMYGAAFVAVVLAASLLGFLWHNLPPAKIFLGDSGSLMLGFLVGALSLEASTKRATGLILAVPVVLLGIPIFDTVMAIVRRKLNGRSIGQGDRAHIHHRLQDRGWSASTALAVIAGFCLLTAGAALVSAWLRSEFVAIVACTSIFGVLIVGRVFGYEEAFHLTYYLRSVGRILAARAGLLRAELALTQQEEPDREKIVWTELCRRTRKLGGERLDVFCRRLNDERLVWRKTWTPPEPAGEQTKPDWEIVYTVHKRDGNQLVVTAQGRLSNTPPAAALAELLHLSNKLYREWRSSHSLEHSQQDSSQRRLSSVPQDQPQNQPPSLSEPSQTTAELSSRNLPVEQKASTVQIPSLDKQQKAA